MNETNNISDEGASNGWEFLIEHISTMELIAKILSSEKKDLDFKANVEDKYPELAEIKKLLELFAGENNDDEILKIYKEIKLIIVKRDE